MNDEQDSSFIGDVVPFLATLLELCLCVDIFVVRCATLDMNIYVHIRYVLCIPLWLVNMSCRGQRICSCSMLIFFFLVVMMHGLRAFIPHQSFLFLSFSQSSCPPTSSSRSLPFPYALFFVLSALTFLSSLDFSNVYLYLQVMIFVVIIIIIIIAPPQS